MLDEGKKKFDGKRKRPNEDSIDSIKRSSYPFNKYNRCPKTSRIKNVYTRKKKKKTHGRIRGTGARPREGGNEMEDGGSGEKGRGRESIED